VPYPRRSPHRISRELRSLGRDDSGNASTQPESAPAEAGSLRRARDRSGDEGDLLVGEIFQALPGSNFIVNGAAPARDRALVTAGARYELRNGWSFLAKFDGEFSSSTAIYSGTGMVRKTW